MKRTWRCHYEFTDHNYNKLLASVDITSIQAPDSLKIEKEIFRRWKQNTKSKNWVINEIYTPELIF